MSSSPVAPARRNNPILYQFFTASRLGDTTSLQSFATVTLDPRRDGTVNTFTITGVGPERTSPLTLKTLGQSLDQVKTEDADFTKQKIEYQNANIDAIKRVLKAESGNDRPVGRTPQSRRRGRNSARRDGR